MSTLWDRPKHTVRGKPSARTVLAFSLAACAAVAAATYQVGLCIWTPANPDPTYTATVEVIERPTLPSNSADSPRIVDKASPGKQNASPAAGGEKRTTFTFTAAETQTAIEEANALAERHVQDRRAEWQAQAEKAVQTAYEKTAAARRAYKEAVTQLSDLEQQMADDAVAETLPAQPAEPPAPIEQPTAENPKWRELDDKLATLKRRHTELLVDRTPEHPAVLEVVAQIADIEAKLKTVPPRIPVQEESAPGKPSPEELAAETAAKEKAHKAEVAEQQKKQFQELTALVSQRGREYDNADLAAKMASHTATEAPEFAIQPPQTEENPPQVDHGQERLLATTLATGLLAACGCMALGLGVRLEPCVANVTQVQGDLGVPVLGTVPANTPIANPSRLSRRQSHHRRLLITIGLAALSACLLVGVMGLYAIGRGI